MYIFCLRFPLKQKIHIQKAKNYINYILRVNMTECNESSSTESQEPSLVNCCLCSSLFPDNLLLFFFDTIYEEIINNMLPFGLHVPREDNLPKKICRTCIGKLIDVQQIVEGFIEADKKLKDASKNSNFGIIKIKDEIEVSEDILNVEKIFLDNTMESLHTEMEFEDPLLISTDEKISEATKSNFQVEEESNVLNGVSIARTNFEDHQPIKKNNTNTVFVLLARPISCNPNLPVGSSLGTTSHQNAIGLSAEKTDCNKDPKYEANCKCTLECRKLEPIDLIYACQEFDALKDFSKEQSFLRGCISCIPVKPRKIKNTLNEKRQYTFHYFIPTSNGRQARVCKQNFCIIFKISRRRADLICFELSNGSINVCKRRGGSRNIRNRVK